VRGDGSKEKIRQFLLSNIGRVIESHELQAAAGGAVQYSRRLRELREQEGWKILSHNDSTNLKPGQYLLVEPPSAKGHVTIERGISAKLRAQVFDRNGFTCQMCGLTPGDIDPYTRRKVRLHVGHIVDKNIGGKEELSNLRTLCSTCNQGAKNITAEKPSTVWLLSQIRRSGIAEQRAAYDWLKRKFETAV
jgi:HNH endonuclease